MGGASRGACVFCDRVCSGGNREPTRRKTALALRTKLQLHRLNEWILCSQRRRNDFRGADPKFDDAHLSMSMMNSPQRRPVTIFAAPCTTLKKGRDLQNRGMPINADHVPPAKGVNAMTLRHHFHAYLDGVRQEGRYRFFTDLERHAARPPYACWSDGNNCR